MKTLVALFLSLALTYFNAKPSALVSPKASFVLECELINTAKMKVNPMFADVALSFPDTIYGHLTTYICNDTAVSYYTFKKLDKVAAANPKLHHDKKGYCIVMDLKNKTTKKISEKITTKKVIDFSELAQLNEDTKYTYYKGKRGDTNYPKIQTSKLLPAYFSPLGCTNMDKGGVAWDCSDSKISLIKLEKKSFDLSKIRVK